MLQKLLISARSKEYNGSLNHVSYKRINITDAFGPTKENLKQLLNKHSLH